MKFYAINYKEHFHYEGYVAENEKPHPKTNKPERFWLNEPAWNAFLANAVMTKALLFAWQKINDDDLKRRGFGKLMFPVGIIFPDLERDALTPIVGKAIQGIIQVL